MFDHFRGKIYQVLEALDYGDAVSNQVLRLHHMIKSFGIKCEIYSKYSHPEVSNYTNKLEELCVDEKDIIFYHFSGYAKFSAETVKNSNCSRVLIYHNITPAKYFPFGTKQYEHCHEGRKQLQAILSHFHFYLGVSQYNLNALLRRGVHRNRCAFLPIIVPEIAKKKPQIKKRCVTWLFVGRLASNKKQDELIKQFLHYLREYDADAQLFLVGAFDKDDEYYNRIAHLIRENGFQEKVILTGKVSDDELYSYFKQADVYVSLSEHEGFGVPLVEATHFGIPVIAMNSSAVPETLINSPGLIKRFSELPKIVNEVFTNDDFYGDVIEHQNNVVDKYYPSTVRFKLELILSKIIPSKYYFKSVSIIICTYNRSEYLDRCLEYLQYQTHNNFEVIVVNGPSSDDTKHVLEKYDSKIKIVENKATNLSISRNLGIERASGDIVAFMDDDALPYDDWVENILEAYNSVPFFVAAVGGPTFYAGSLDYQDQDLQFNSYGETRPNLSPQQTSEDGWFRYLIGTNATFKRHVLFEIDGFDEQYDYYLDETDLCLRLNLQNNLIYYDPNVFMRHEFAQSENRKGGYNYNWFKICKNTAYFIIKANPDSTAEHQNSLIDAHMEKFRIQYFQNAFDQGEITINERDAFVCEVWKGVKQGIEDARNERKTRTLKDKSIMFLPYQLNRFYPLKGKSIAQLHVVILSKEFPPFTKIGGIGTLYYNLASELLQMGHNVTVITQGTHEEEYLRGRFAIIKTPNIAAIEDQWQAPSFVNNINWAITARDIILKLHIERRIDIIDTALWDFEAFALLQDKAHNIPICVRLVTPLKVAMEINQWQMTRREKKLMMMAEKEIIENSDIVIPISKSIEKSIIGNYDVEPDYRWRRSYIGIAFWPTFDVSFGYNELRSFPTEIQKISSDTFKVLFFGRLEKRKGIDVFLNAIKIINTNGVRMCFIIAGEDIEGWQERNQFDENFKQQIIFLGRVEDVKKDILFQFADVLVFPSRYESFGLVPLEAFVHGTPVIAANAGAIPEVVLHDQCGLLFDSDSPADLAGCINRLAEDRGLKTRLSIGAKERIKDFSSRKMAAETMNIYTSLLD